MIYVLLDVICWIKHLTDLLLGDFSLLQNCVTGFMALSFAAGLARIHYSLEKDVSRMDVWVGSTSLPLDSLCARTRLAEEK